MKSGNLNFLEPSGPLQACDGTALPLPLLTYKNCALLGYQAAGSGNLLEGKKLPLLAT